MKKDTKTTVGKRFLWLAFLLLILSTFALIVLVRKNKANVVKHNIEGLSNIKNNYQKIDTCISILYIAENNSRLFTVTGDTVYHRQFVSQLATVSKILEEFKNQKNERTLPTDVNQLLTQKKDKNKEFSYLKTLTDSLLILSTKEIAIREERQPMVVPKPKVKVRRSEQVVKVDSVKVTQQRSRKKLWGRLAEAISNKSSYNNQIQVSSTRNKSDSLLEETAALYETNLRAMDNYYKDLLAYRKELNATEKELLRLNGLIFSKLQGSLTGLKQSEAEEAELQRKQLLAGTLTDVQELNLLSQGSIAIIFFLTCSILYTIWRLYRNEISLLQYSRQVTKYAKMKGDFLATISHEIRTPLNSIIGFSEQIVKTDLPKEQQPKLEAIRSSSGILMTLVNDILDFSKLESGKIELSQKPFQPYLICQEMVAMLGIQADKKNITLRSELKYEAEATLLGDGFRMKQVLMNLLSNAIKFTPVGGKVTLSSSLAPIMGNQVLWSFQIKDTGIGISKENLGIIFNDFQQLEHDSKVERSVGTGLGLAICKRIVELAGGTIKVTSELGVGSTFSVDIPMELTTQSEMNTHSSSIEREIHELLQEKQVLIVDDNKMNLLLLGTILKKKNVTFQQATNGQIAYEMFDAHPFDLVITDIQMPVMDGVELTRQIRTHGDNKKSSVPIIGFTAQITAEEQERYHKLGMNDFLNKPFVEKDLKALLNKVLSTVTA
ncbi:hybrid sensor histidine kinase/response regulator [Siphonobacter sp. BAB-5385]|uniref:response regulator n=1 Tax=Siphonobacter sp. BAB-5385 TaxID=1864822 RepID=UPI000B9EBC1B|nr:response regulator [Siphonobacter sp. BAB-5385]OZI09986.1 hybrid sensor histidine kinase/response regulator [Siphonobacter sp. BAB-5385]